MYDVNNFESIWGCQKCKMPTFYSGKGAVQQPALAEHNNEKHNVLLL